MKLLTLVYASLILFSTLFPLHAQTTITFEGANLKEGDSVTNQFGGVSFEGAFLALPGFPRTAFNVFGGADADLVTSELFEGEFITDEPDEFNTPGTIAIIFDDVANDISFLLGDIDFQEVYVVNAFGRKNDYLGFVVISDQFPNTGDAVGTLIEMPIPNIKRLEIGGNNPMGASGWGVDYLTFTLGGILFGDVNEDGQVDLLDVAPFIELLTDGGFLSEADINQDGSVDLLDVAPFASLLSGN